MNKNKEWEKDFDKEMPYTSNFLKDTLGSIRYEDLIRWFDNRLFQAEDNMRKRCLEEIEKLKTVTKHVILPRHEVDKPREYDVVYIRKNEATQNINNLDKSK